MDYLDIELDGIDTQGNESKVKLKDLQGKNIVLYFYPKDDTPVCTEEAHLFKERADEFPDDTMIIGVSADDIESHKNFMEKHGLKFHLIADIKHKLGQAFDVVKEKIMGEEPDYEIERATFILDKEGKIVKEYRDIQDVNKHVEEVIEYVKTM